MAKVGPLAIHTDDNDLEDSDFFDQLADEFGNEDLGHLNRTPEQEEKDRLDEAFSKLIVGEEETAAIPAIHDPVSIPASAITDQIDEDNSASDDFWLEENLVEETPAESKGDTYTHAAAADSLVEFPQLDVPPSTEGSPTSRDLQAETTLSSDATHLEDFGVENVSMAKSENFVLVENNAVLGALSTPAQVGNIPEAEHEIEGSALKDVCLPEIDATMASGLGTDLPCIPIQETSVLDPSASEDKDSLQHVTDPNSPPVVDALTPDGPCDGVPGAQPITEASALDHTDRSSDGIYMESVNAQSMPNDDVIGATQSQLSPSVKELQWSSFGDTCIPSPFGSYSDFFSDLGIQTGLSSNQETVGQNEGYQAESLTEPSLTFSVGGESSGTQASLAFHGTAVDQFDETGFWNQQGVLNYGTSEQANSNPANTFASFFEPQAVESKQSGFADAVSEAGGANYSLGTENQVQEEVQQNWESMYPGWYFDYASNQWRQIEGWGAVEEQLPLKEEVDPSYSQTTQNGQVVSTTSNLTWQTNQGQASWSGLGSNESFEAGNQASSNDQQIASDSIPQEQANWEEQYPGWYYDYQAQQWRQISDDSQSWASNQDNKFEAPQVVGSTNTSQLSGGWIDQQVQPHYQSETNQNIYLPERSHSLYSNSGGGVNILNRGVSFNSWAQPAVEVDGVGQQGMDNIMQGSNTESWTGLQGHENTVPSHTYQSVTGSTHQSQTDYNLADKSPFFGSTHGFFQPHNISGGSIEGARSSAGRPLHALVAFGFGGRLVTMKAPQLGTSEPLVLRDLNQLVLNADKRGESDGFSYFSALSRQGLSGPLHGATSKDLLKWVDERIENCGMEYSQGMSSEGLRLLWGVLKIACLHYGKLRSMAGSTGLKSQMEDGPEAALGRLLTAAKSQGHWNQGLAISLDALHASPTGHQLQAAADAVRSYLMDGKRNEALQLAQQGELWGLALVLAWQLGEKVYADTVVRMAQQQFLPGSPLRTLLLLFAGQTSELFKIQNLPLSAGTPGPFFPAASNAQDSAGGMLGDWLGNLSIIAANPTKGDEQVLTHLGDSLWKDQGEVAGAHTCYLVAETSFEWFSKEARLCLVGADHFKYQRTFATPQAIQRTELYEYAKILGNSQFVLVPFQPFKLLYAHMLAEAGKITEACRYCQIVTRNLKNAGRGPEIEFCKQSAVALEERLRQHSQGGYSLNFSTGKLVGKVMGTIDSTIHKIIGGPPLPPVSQPSPAFGSPQGWYANDSKNGNANTSAKATPLIPSASNSNLFSVNSQVDVPTRSISEPNLISSSAQEVHNAAASSETSSASPKQLKSTGTSGGYLGRFGSQVLSKALGFIKHNKEAKLGDENKFYYDEKLKRWVEAGVEQSTEEVALAPPPIVASFNSSFGTPSTDAKSGGELQGQGLSATSLSSSADLPPMPPSVNQFSARGRLHGVRSRYVDTFNKGNTELAAKPSQSPIVPAGGGGWGMASTPSQFFASASVSSATDGSSQMHANGHINDGSPDFLKSASEHSQGGHLQVEHEPLLPKNLHASFMDVPVFHKHSSASNLAMLTNSDSATNKTGAFGASTSGNMARAVSWSGEPPSAGTQKYVSSGSNTYAMRRLPNGFIADTQMELSVNSAAAVSDTTLPSPPIIEPPAPFQGYERSQMQTGIAGKTSSGSLQGVTYGEMQEVEL
eukprot:c25199_g1_i1 orf=455-5497(+)